MSWTSAACISQCLGEKTLERVPPDEAVQPLEVTMLGWALTFLVIALIAAALGFGGVAGTAAGIAQIIFYIFLVLLVISLVMHFVRGTAP